MPAVHPAVAAARRQGFRPPGLLQFGVFFQGVNSGTVWKSELAGSQTDVESFRRLIGTAERGLFAAFFLGEGLRLREHLGRIHDLDVAGRPDAQTMLAALAAVTTRIGLVATQNTTFNDAADLAHRLATLDLLSEGRAAWNVVTTDNAWTGANFRRGGYLDHADRYTHAEFVVRTVKRIWDSWADDWAGSATGAPGALPGQAWIRPGAVADVEGADSYFSVALRPELPRSPQRHPVIFQAGDSPQGRDFAARQADVIFSAHPRYEAAAEFRDDIVGRTLAAGRPAGDVKIMPVAEFVLAATDREAEEKLAWVREHQIGPQQALAYLEQFWGRELSGYDPDGPLPGIDPVIEETGSTRGTSLQGARAKELAARFRAEAAEKGQSIRQFATERVNPPGSTFSGSYARVADDLARYARDGVVDGFNISPWLIPAGIDDVVDRLVPLLQERGVYPAEYAGTTLREHLGLRPPERGR